MNLRSLISAHTQSFDPVHRIQKDLNRLFEDMWFNQNIGKLSQCLILSPSIDMEETAKEITIHGELPGLEEQDISVELIDNLLVIRGEKKIDRSEKDKNYHIIERGSGSFMRSIELPLNTIQQDQIKASFKNGVLTITIPKTEEERKVKKILLSDAE